MTQSLGAQLKKAILTYLESEYKGRSFEFFEVSGERVPFHPHNFEEIADKALLDKSCSLYRRVIEKLAFEHLKECAAT